MKNFFGFRFQRAINIAASTGAVLAGAISAQAAVTYSTSFESPAFVAGTSAAGSDGWLAGTAAAAHQMISAARSSQGSQSLLFENPASDNPSSSVYHSLGSFSGTILTLSVDLYVSSVTTPTRLSEIEFSTGFLGDGVLGISLDGGGRLRAGKANSALYGAALLATAPAGTYADRWLTATLTLDTSTAAGTVSMSGFGGATSSYSASFTAVNTPTNVNLGSDFNVARDTGTAYYDRLSISTVPVPEPSALAAAFMGAGLLALTIRRRRAC